MDYARHCGNNGRYRLRIHNQVEEINMQTSNYIYYEGKPQRRGSQSAWSTGTKRQEKGEVRNYILFGLAEHLLSI